MKIKDGFMLREIAEQWIVVPIGERTVEFNALITLTETGAFLWRMLESECVLEGLVSSLTKEYEVSDEKAAKDVVKFIDQLKEASLLC